MPLSFSARRQQLRMLAEDSTIPAIGVPSALAAKLVQQVGYPAIYLSGATLSTNLLGLPDVGLLTLSEVVQQTSYIAQACDLPLIVDADTGFGEAVNVTRTVQLLEQAGASAIQLEDQVLPKKCGHLDGKSLVSTEAMCEKIRAAKQAQTDEGLILIARTDARAVEGFDESIRRAEAYLAAGADWIFPEALQSEAEFRAFAEAVPAPLIANMTEFGKSPLLPMATLADAGYAVVLYPVTLHRIAMKSMEVALGVLRAEGSQQSLLDLMQTRQELYDLIDYDGLKAADERNKAPQ